MKNFSSIQALVGESVTENDLKNVDCYVNKKVGLFIPSMGSCGYAAKPQHSHPSYMVIICFPYEASSAKCDKANHYKAYIVSPELPHDDVFDKYNHYYCIMIDREYFEEQYAMYADDEPYFNMTEFEMCSDILKTLNTFAFEYGKDMKNSDITLDAQAVVITHWIIRSILGENFDMRAVSDNYAVARVQHYIACHYDEEICVGTLANLAHMSLSSFNRLFKKEIGITPMEYVIEEKIEKSKKLLRRKDMTITEIASKCGFGSSAHFSSAFKRITGVAPSQYRDSYLK